jgi:site-specific DNA recombinase
MTNGKSSYQAVKVCACSYNRDRGKTVCTNTLRRPVDIVNQSVVDWIKSNVLSEELTLEVLKQLRHRLAERAKLTTSDVPQLEKEAVQLRTEINRLVQALASTDQKPEAIVRAIAERQEQLSTLDARLRAAKAAPEAIQLEVRRMEAEAKKRIGDLRAMLDRNPEDARKVLATLFETPLNVTPIETAEGKRFWIEGAAVVGRMLATDAGCLNSASPAGFEPA